MRKSRKRLIAKLLLVCLALAGSAQATQTSTSDWVTLAPAGEGFTVLLPEKPQLQTQNVPLMGVTYEMQMYTASEKSSGLLFIVVQQKLPPVTAMLAPVQKLEKFMEGFQEGLGKSLPNVKLEMKYERDLNLKRRLGRQYSLTVAESRGLARVYDGNSRVYLLLAMGGDENNASIARFLMSFNIDSAAAVASPGF